MRNLLFLTLLVWNANALGRCDCACSWGGHHSEISANSSGCNVACNPRCPFSGLFANMEGTWKVLTNENGVTPPFNSKCNSCCFTGKLYLEDTGTILIGSFESASGCNYGPAGNLSYWPGSRYPFQAFAQIFPGTPIPYNPEIYIGYDNTTGKGTVNWPYGATQKLQCLSGPCRQNFNSYSASTKQVVTYAFVWMVLLFIAPKN